MTTEPIFSAPDRVFTPVELDASQLAVVTVPVGVSASVFGAAGSGKTAALIELVAQRVQHDGFRADEILVLTPQRHAANRLRLALGERLRVATNGPLARTPMSLAFSLATEGALSRGVEPPSMLTGSEQDALLASLLELETSSVQWPATLGYDVRQSRTFRSELRDLFARCTNLGWGPEDLATAAASRSVPEWQAAAAFWELEYEEALADMRHNHFDVSALLRQGAVALTDRAVAPLVKLVVVDDAQELTRGAMGIVQAFVDRGVPAILFSEPDTAATTFRGAVPSLAGEFAAAQAGGRILTLSHIHRQAGVPAALVRDLTGRIGAAAAGTQRSALTSPVAPQTTLDVIERPTFVGELMAIARRLREFHVHEGIPFSRMAVVLRSGGSVSEVARVLSINEVPTTTLISDRSLIDQSIVRDLLCIIDVALGRRALDSHTATGLLLSPLCGLSIIEVRRLRLALRHDEIAAGGTRTGAQLLPLVLTGALDISHITLRASSKAQAFAKVLAELAEDSVATAEEMLWRIWSWSHLKQEWTADSAGHGVLAEEANRNLDGVVALFTAARRFVEREPQAAVTDFVDLVSSSDVPEDSLASQAAIDAAIVCTPAALIGSEFDVVVVAGVQEGRWPNLRPRGSLLHAQLIDEPESVDQRKQVLDDELRMFVLAASRARTHLIVSSTSGNDDSPSPIARIAAKLASPLCDNGQIIASENRVDNRTETTEYPLSLRGMTGYLRRQLVRECAKDSPDEALAANLASGIAALSEAGAPGANPQEWYGIVPVSTEEPLAVLESDGGSDPEAVFVNPSSLEKWRENPFSWFLGGTVGFEGNYQSGIGTLIHEVFEATSLDESIAVDSESLWARIEPRWAELAIEPEWESERQRVKVRKLLGALSQYILDTRASGKIILGVEAGFTIPVGKGFLKGKADRLELTLTDLKDDKLNGTIEVIDLKTGSSKPAKRDMNQHIQLACYQFALHEGGFVEVPGVGESPLVGGASLIFLNKVAGEEFTYDRFRQGAMPVEPNAVTPEDVFSVHQMRDMIAEAVEGMAGDTFTAIIYTREERGAYDSTWSKRIHLIQAVSG